MALVVLLKGINVGGHRRFRPSVLAKELERFGVVSIGAAGTFVVRKPVGRTVLRAELLRRLPFDADVMICSGNDIVRLGEGDPFAGQPSGPGIVRFVSVLARRRPPLSPLPMDIPSGGRWCVRILTHEDRYVCGVHRREMKAIGYLGQIQKIVGVPVTTRSWSTILSIRELLARGN